MYGGDRDLDTICAISTPPGHGGIHVIRVSGFKSLNIVRLMAPFLPETVESHRLYFGTLYWDGQLTEPIDEVLISYFKKGSSFTGEETIEISCHGSPFIASQIIKSLIKSGARAADRGEFTYRSFINGNVDLVQAESILSLIESESAQSSKIALLQLKGGLSKEFKEIEKDLLALLARLEISIDFTTEDIEIINNSEIISRLESLILAIKKLVQSFKLGNKIQSGYSVLLIGEPNVGKSSLLNSILQEERAIVTEIPGTTRDLIHESIIINGVKVNITDTAGIRDSDDKIEQIGISKTKEALESADLILAIFDCSQPRIDNLLENLPKNKSKTVFIGNKRDLITKDLEKELETNLVKSHGPDLPLIYFTSTLESKEPSTLVQKQILQIIEENLDTGSFGDEAIVSQTRHFENLQRTMECFSRAIDLAHKNSSPEFLALEVKEGLVRIQEILGERFDDQIMDRVFSEFCIGK